MLISGRVVGYHIGGRPLGQVLVGCVGSIEAVAAVGVECEPGHRCIQAVAQACAVIDIAVVAGYAAADSGVFVAAVAVRHCYRRIVGAGQGDRQAAGAGGTMLIGDRVVGYHIGGRPIGQVLVGCVGSIEAIATVSVERQSGHRCIQAVAQACAVIDIAVVAGYAAADSGVFVAAVAVRHCYRRIVGAGQGDRQAAGAGGTMLIGDRVVGYHIGGRPLGQVLVGCVGSIEAVAAVGVECEPGHRCIQAVAQARAIIDIAVVAGYAAADGGVFVSAVAVRHCYRRIVGAGQGDGERAGARGTVLVGHRVVGHYIGGRALGQVLVRSVGSIEAVAAVGVERESGHRCIQAVAQARAIIDIAVV